MSQTISESLLDVLADAGARDVFGMVGDAINPFVEAVIKDERFRWIGVRHEEHAAYAAYAQSELTGKIGVCAGTSGPGALHLINGMYNARKEHGGVVAVTGQVPQSQRGSNFHKEMDLFNIFADACHYQAVINTPEMMPRMAEIAAQKALVERATTRIEIPNDIIDKVVPSDHFKRPIVHRRPEVVPLRDQLEQAADVINSGKRVTLFCGVGTRQSKEAVLDMAERLQCPIAHSLRAHDIFDYSDGPVMGMTGLIGGPAGYHAVIDADVLVMIGTDFPYDEFLPDGIPIVQIDIRVDHIGRRAPVTHGLVGGVEETLAELVPMVSGDSSKFRDGLAKMRDRWIRHQDEQASLRRKDEPIHAPIVAKAISDAADDDAFFAVDVGEPTIWVARHMSMAGDRRMAGGFNHGSLGPGLPVAIGAAAVDPSRQVWALVGDGGFGMSMNEFVTAVRYDWPINVVVFNNSELSFVKMEMEVSGMATNDSVRLVNPDFAAYAKACGGDGVRVEHIDDLLPAIDQAIASPKPFIIDAIVSPGELTMPPHLDIKTAYGFGMSKVKEALLLAKGDHQVWQDWRDEFRATIY